MSISHLDKCVIIIHDKMDHTKIVSPYFASKNKSIDAFMRLMVIITGMIVHGLRRREVCSFFVRSVPV